MYHKRLLTQSHKKDHLCAVKKLILLTGLFTVPLKKNETSIASLEASVSSREDDVRSSLDGWW